ncbi:MAG: TlpA disulfide reductase family protein [candidate division Zixibacteria bacterium]|nr:TlpA disulfide reductase family protein [candidate division Zixibacteria bacterium]
MLKQITHILSISLLVALLLACSKDDSASQTGDDSSSVTDNQPANIGQSVPQDTAGSLPKVASTDSGAQGIVPSDGKITESPKEIMLDPSAVSFAAYDSDGNLRNSSEWIGKKAVVINFWGTWCPPCRAEIPALVQLYDEYKDQGVEIVSIALNDTPEKVNGYAAKADMRWIQLMGDESVVSKFGSITAVPTTIFLSPSGKEIQRFVGSRDHGTFKSAFELVSKS